MTGYAVMVPPFTLAASGNLERPTCLPRLFPIGLCQERTQTRSTAQFNIGQVRKVSNERTSLHPSPCSSCPRREATYEIGPSFEIAGSRFKELTRPMIPKCAYRSNVSVIVE